ncbi:hypothetical protein K1719_019258 [Acacia pycnantha]|nr:hypothetical protein K1719_019258 [Acacia pycnantha]
MLGGNVQAPSHWKRQRFSFPSPHLHCGVRSDTPPAISPDLLHLSTIQIHYLSQLLDTWLQNYKDMYKICGN